MTFPLAVPLAGGVLDRAAQLRARPDRLAALFAAPEARGLALMGGKPPIDLSDGAPRLAWVDAAALEVGVENAVFLGCDDDGAGRFAASQRFVEGALGPNGSKYIDLRSIAPELSAAEAGIVAEAKSLLSWHETHPYCACCGAATQMAQGGWRRDCPSCGAKHFPRTDPVVIMLVVRRAGPMDAEDRVVLGRQRNWPPKLHSLLAGYVEPGESLESAVRRETQEEAGVEVGEVRYLASQPWPFPSTLMIGCYAEALSDEIAPDDDELESVRWATKSDLRAALDGRHPELMAPRQDAIARSLVQAWVDDTLQI